VKPKKSKQPKTTPNAQAHWTKEPVVFDAVCDAYRIVQARAAGRDSPVARSTMKILQGLMAATRDNDLVALKRGEAWVRAHGVEGGRAPQSELVRTLYEIVKARRCVHIQAKDHYEGCRLEGIAMDAAVKIAVSGLFAVGGPEKCPALAQRIKAGLVARESEARALCDDELRVKSILIAAGLAEPDAGRWVHGARL
jgi:hypothetical protein